MKSNFWLDGSVELEIYANEGKDKEIICEEMKLIGQVSGESNLYAYQASVPANIPEQAHTVSIIPFFPGVAVPLEEGHILWQK